LDSGVSQADCDIVFPYRVQGGTAAFSVLLLGFFAGLMVFLAVSEPGSLIGVHIGAPYGALVYGGLAVGSLGMAVLLLQRHRAQRGRGRAIVFGVKAVTLPESLTSARFLTIDYDVIEKVDYESVDRAGMNFIRIDGGGLHIRISDIGFERQTDFHEVYDLLRKKAMERQTPDV